MAIGCGAGGGAMKVLMMHRNDGLAGGAQIQMNRLRAGLLGAGVDARILCREKRTEEAVAMPGRPLAERFVGALTRRMGLNDIHLLGSSAVARMPEVVAADVMDIHCLHSGTFSYLALPGLTTAKPVVFTFHDMWPLTGHCHASLECGRWKHGCGACPHLETEPAVARDATAVEWRLKQWAYRRSRFTVVTPSRWLAEQVRQSMLADWSVRHIPHGLDLSVFRPLDRARCREILGLPPNGTVLLCVMERMNRPLKGADLLVEAIHRLPEAQRRDLRLVVVGHSDPLLAAKVPVPVHALGYIENDPLKAVAYSAADLLVNPSRAESFGLVALESMACGTPVVAFDVGGLPELVRPGVSGALAPSEDVSALAHALAKLLDDVGLRRQLAARSLEVVQTEHDLNLQVSRTIDIYKETQEAFRRSGGRS